MGRVAKVVTVASFAFAPAAILFLACGTSPVAVPPLRGFDAGPDADAADVDDAADADAGHAPDADAGDSMMPPLDAGVGPLCSLPGSVQFSDAGVGLVPGGPSTDVSYVHVPNGFCVHYFGNVGDARQVRVAPGGEIFVASPTTGTTGGNSFAGKASIVILPDDDHDGTADTPITFLESLPSTQGMMFANDHFYYQDGTKIMRLPYNSGDRAPSGPSELVADITVYSSTLHWPKPIDIADDGTIYVGNGGDQNEVCDPTRPFHGGILKLDGTPGGNQVSKGFRNPIAVRCQRGHNHCFALELALDYSANLSMGGREKMIPINQGDDLGFPCCATKGIAYPATPATVDCSTTIDDTDSFLIGDTPFGFDFEPGKWPAPYTNGAFVAMHGAAGTWTGARLLTIDVDPTTGEPLAGNNLVSGDTGGMHEFATGWDNAGQAHGRPAAVTFTPDGRLFLTNDTTGDIVWIAPLNL